jgi:ribosome biogenesis GTPase
MLPETPEAPIERTGIDAPLTAVVVASHGIHAVVRLPDGRIIRAAQPRDEEYAVVGDRVDLEPGAGGGELPLIVRFYPRQRVLIRASKGEVQTLAAHVDELLIVVAVEPPAREGLIDRFCVAAAYSNIAPVIVLNKVDLPGSADIEASLAMYRAVGYDVLRVSAHTGEGIEALRQRLGRGTHVLAGHSGVGKSSILNSLLGTEHAATAQISAIGRGRHTTTTAVAWPVGEGLLVDMPGVRSFALAEIEPEHLRFCFPEFDGAREACAFSSCLHYDEPNCGVREAVRAGNVAPPRYQSYRKLLEEIEKERRDERGYGRRKLPKR